MDKPEVFESYQPHSGRYSLRKDLRLNAWLGVTAVVYMAVLLLVKRHAEWSPLARGLISLVPVVPGLLYVRSWARLVRSLDELQRRIQLEAFLFAALATVIVGVIATTLSANGVDLGPLLHPSLGLGGVFISLFVFWLVGSAIANCRYK